MKQKIDYKDFSQDPENIIPHIDGFLRQFIHIHESTQKGDYAEAMTHAKAWSNPESRRLTAVAMEIVDARWDINSPMEEIAFEWEAMMNELYEDHPYDIVEMAMDELRAVCAS